MTKSEMKKADRTKAAEDCESMSSNVTPEDLAKASDLEKHIPKTVRADLNFDIPSDELQADIPPYIHEPLEKGVKKDKDPKAIEKDIEKELGTDWKLQQKHIKEMKDKVESGDEMQSAIPPYIHEPLEKGLKKDKKPGEIEKDIEKELGTDWKLQKKHIEEMKEKVEGAFVDIEEGDKIEVAVQRPSHWKGTGTVKSASNYGTKDKPDWYIEFIDDKGKYHYFKQKPDSGTVEKLGASVECASLPELDDKVKILEGTGRSAGKIGSVVRIDKKGFRPTLVVHVPGIYESVWVTKWEIVEASITASESVTVTVNIPSSAERFDIADLDDEIVAIIRNMAGNQKLIKQQTSIKMGKLVYEVRGPFYPSKSGWISDFKEKVKKLSEWKDSGAKMIVSGVEEVSADIRKEIMKGLDTLRNKDERAYDKIVENWRDVVPHTGQQDVLDGLKFEAWLGGVADVKDIRLLAREIYFSLKNVISSLGKSPIEELKARVEKLVAWKIRGRKPVIIKEFPSSSNPSKKYETVKWSDGSWSCNCKGWAIAKNGQRICRHVKEMGGRPVKASVEEIKKGPGHLFTEDELRQWSKKSKVQGSTVITAETVQAMMNGMSAVSRTFSGLLVPAAMYVMKLIVEENKPRIASAIAFSEPIGLTDIQTDVDATSLGINSLTAIYEDKIITAGMKYDDYQITAYAKTRDAAKAWLDGFEGAVISRNQYRGKCLYAERNSLEFKDTPDTNWEDVVLPEKIKADIKLNTVDFLGNVKLASVGVLKRGIMMYGPPGTGKTSIVKAVFRELQGKNVSRIYVTAESFGRMSVGNLFAILGYLGPTVLCFEDVDLVSGNRDGAISASSSLLGDLLTNLDGMRKHKEPLVIMASTNRIELLDSALSARPGRFDRRVEIGLPNAEHLGKIYAKLVGETVPNELLVLSAGFTGAHCVESVNTARILAANQGKKVVECLQEACTIVRDNFFPGQTQIQVQASVKKHFAGNKVEASVITAAKYAFKTKGKGFQEHTSLFMNGKPVNAIIRPFKDETEIVEYYDVDPSGSPTIDIDELCKQFGCHVIKKKNGWSTKSQAWQSWTVNKNLSKIKASVLGKRLKELEKIVGGSHTPIRVNDWIDKIGLTYIESLLPQGFKIRKVIKRVRDSVITFWTPIGKNAPDSKQPWLIINTPGYRKGLTYLRSRYSDYRSTDYTYETLEELKVQIKKIISLMVHKFSASDKKKVLSEKAKELETILAKSNPKMRVHYKSGHMAKSDEVPFDEYNKEMKQCKCQNKWKGHPVTKVEIIK